MSAITRCRAHREPRPACLPVRRPADALAVILTAAASPARPETICVLLDHAHRGLGVIVVEGAMADDGIFEIAEVVLAPRMDAEPSGPSCWPPPDPAAPTNPRPTITIGGSNSAPAARPRVWNYSIGS